MCPEIEQIFYDADDVLRHTITVDFSASPTLPGHMPTPKELAYREQLATPRPAAADRRIRLGAAGTVPTKTSTAAGGERGEGSRPWRGAGLGMPAALFLPGVAYLGITNGHQFIANDFSPSYTAWPALASPRSR